MLTFFKKIFFVRNNWNQVFKEIAKKENSDIAFPVIIFEKDVDHEFVVFCKPEEIIQESINGHWGGITPDCNETESYLIDSNGRVLNIKNNIYSEKFKISYSFPKQEIGKIEVFQLKSKILNACKFYIEVFGVDYKQKNKELLNALKEATTIIEIIEIAKELES